MLKCNQKLNRGSVSLRELCFAITALAFAPLAQAQFDTTVTAGNGLSCASDRGSNSCTAKEFTVTVSATQGSNIQSCQNNLPVTLDVVANITSKSTTRYNVGLFIGEDGNSPDASPVGDTCSVATFPTAADPPSTSTAWFDADGNACGDYNGGNLATSNLIHNVTVLCVPDAATGTLSIPYALTYEQNQGGTCTGPSDVQPGAGSKCVGGGTPVAGVVITYNADPGCGGKTVSYDPVAGTVTSTFTIQNNDPNNGLPPEKADGSTFEDNVPGPVVVTNITCTPAGGAAGCDTSATVGNDVKGTIATFPTGSSVLVTIVGTVPGGSVGAYENTATVTPSAIVTVTSDSTGNNSCSNSTTLPVKLQSFDVH